MIRCQLLTSWATITKGGQTAYQPLIVLDYPLAAGHGCVDVTGQDNVLPTPNACVVEAVFADDTFAAIQADPKYGPGAILWSEAYP